ncbi:MAG: CotH kinase family protein [bacterium]
MKDKSLVLNAYFENIIDRAITKIAKVRFIYILILILLLELIIPYLIVNAMPSAAVKLLSTQGKSEYNLLVNGSPVLNDLDISTGNPNETAEDNDSSAVIFDDTIVRNYELHFYYGNWADSLNYYYLHGEEYIPAQLKYGTMILDSIGVRYKGNSSYMMSGNTPKKPFKFKFNKYKKGQTFFDMKVMNFSNCAKDPSFMREVISYSIARKYITAPRAVYSNIYIEGELIGLYVQVEEVDKRFLGRHFENNDGNLYKASSEGTTLEYHGTSQSNYEVGLELKTNEDENDWSKLIAMLDKLNNTSAENFVDVMNNCLELDVVCRYLALNMVLSNFDSYTGSGRNFYLYDDLTSGKFQIIPWDLNEAFGAFDNRWNVITTDIVNVPNLNQRPLNRRLLQNESLRNIYLGYIDEMINGAASYDSISALTENYKPLINDYVQADSHKLFTYDQFLSNIENSVNLGSGMGGPPMSIPGIKSFSQQRNANLNTQLVNYLPTDTGDSPVLGTFELKQNFPNPFNPATIIVYLLPSIEAQTNASHHVSLKVYDVLGREIATLVNGEQQPGSYSVEFNSSIAGDLSSGIYFYRLAYANFVDSKKMVLTK